MVQIMVEICFYFEIQICTIKRDCNSDDDLYTTQTRKTDAIGLCNSRTKVNTNKYPQTDFVCYFDPSFKDRNTLLFILTHSTNLVESLTHSIRNMLLRRRKGEKLCDGKKKEATNKDVKEIVLQMHVIQVSHATKQLQ